MHTNRMRKALVLCEVFHPEDFLINDLVKDWKCRGYDVEVLTRVPSYPYGKVYDGFKNKIYQTSSWEETKIHRVPVLQGYQKSTFIKVLNYVYFVFWSCLIVLFIGKRFDRVFIYQTGPLTLATAGVLMNKLFKAKVVLWIQDLWPETVYAFGFKRTRGLTFCLNRFVKWIYKNCDKILISCEGFAKSLKQFVPNHDPIFVPNWSLIEYSPTKSVTLPGEYNFTFAGNIGTVQNLGNIVMGFKLFVKDCPQAWLNIIGDGSFLSDLKSLIKKEQIPNINFTGRKPLKDMSDYYYASDVLLISLKDVPLYEIMIPSKFQAYLTTGKPIYAIFRGEVQDIVETYNIGLVAQPNNINDIANGFKSFILLPQEEYKKMCNNAIHLSSTTFDKTTIIKKIDSVFW